MYINRTIRAVWLTLALLACLVAFAARPAAAQQAIPPDTEQTKTTPTPPAATAAIAAPAAVSTITLVPLRDEQGVLALAVPPAWNDVAQGEWLLEDAPAGRKLSASPNQADFAANWGTPGVTIYYSSSLPEAMEPEDLLAVFDFSATCQDGGRGSLPPAERTAIYQIWQNCGGAGTAAVVLVVYPTATRAYYGVIEVYLAGGDDLAALASILAGVRFGAEAVGGAGASSSSAGEATGSEAAPTPAAVPTLAPPTPEPSPTPTPLPATVVTDRLNLRSGPSTEAERLTVLDRGVQLTVLGQIDNCAWLRVATPAGAQGWVSGDPQLTSLGAACADVPVVENP